MAHPCSNGWTLVRGGPNHFVNFLNAVDAEATRQANGGCDSGGWAYWLFQTDFVAFRHAYHELARALGTPYVPAGEWGGPPPLVPPPPPLGPVNMQPILDATSLDLGEKAQTTLTLLGVDENDLDRTGNPPTPFHPAQGLPGWLLSGQMDPQGVLDAEHLFDAMRHALDR